MVDQNKIKQYYESLAVDYDEDRFENSYGDTSSTKIVKVGMPQMPILE